MIGKGRTGTHFGGLQGYLLHGRSREDAAAGLQDYLLDGKSGAERVEWVAGRNLPTEDPRYAAAVMSATAEQNPRVKRPVYHLSLSAAPGEDLTREQWERVVDRVLGRLGLHEHQALIVAHNDTKHPHVHLMINRVHAEHLKAWSNSHDFRRIERALRHIERDLKLREVPGHHYQLPGQQRPEREGRPTAGERQKAARTGEKTWADRIRFKIYEDLRGAESWADLEHRLDRHRLRLERRGGGLVITDGRQQVKASRVYRRASYRALEQRFGMSFEAWHRDREELVRASTHAERLKQYEAELERRRQRFRPDVRKAEEILRSYQNVNRSARRTVQRIAYELERAYRPGELRAVRRRLGALVRQEGLARAAHLIRDRPGRLGRLNGIGIRGLGNETYSRADIAAQRAAVYLWDLHQVRRRRRQLRPRLQPAKTDRARAWKRLQTISKLLDATPTRQVEKQLARLGIKLGMKAVELVLPSKLVGPVKLAVEMAELARRAARSRGLGRGR